MSSQSSLAREVGSDRYCRLQPSIITRSAREAYAVGGNDHAAYQAGVNVKRTLFTMMVLGSLFAAFVGVILTARISTGEANIGLQYPMQSIIACVIGGIALSGGAGGMVRCAESYAFSTPSGNSSAEATAA